MLDSRELLEQLLKAVNEELPVLKPKKKSWNSLFFHGRFAKITKTIIQQNRLNG